MQVLAKTACVLLIFYSHTTVCNETFQFSCSSVIRIIYGFILRIMDLPLQFPLLFCLSVALPVNQIMLSEGPMLGLVTGDQGQFYYCATILRRMRQIASVSYNLYSLTHNNIYEQHHFDLCKLLKSVVQLVDALWFKDFCLKNILSM